MNDKQHSLTPSERNDIKRRAVRAGLVKAKSLIDGNDATSHATNEPTLPFSAFRGTLKIGDLELECHVLSDGRRVLTQREVVRVLTAGGETSKLEGYLSPNPLIDKDFLGGKVIPFKIPSLRQIAHGYEATILVEICDYYLQARDDGLLGKKRVQLSMAAQAEIIVRACAKVGIIALIDEATGYQQVREKRALQLKLQAFIADELQEWARMFPDEFWIELARLEGIRYSPRSRPLRWGKYVMMFVYDAIDRDVGNELRKKNPNPHFLKNHHQWLQKFGRAQVHDQIQRIVTIMKLCDDMDDFRKKFSRVFKKASFSQLEFDWND